MISWHLKLSDWIFFAAGLGILVSVPLIHMFAFPLWALVKTVYAAGVIVLLIEMKRAA